ncbi:hypothetical protein AVEN_156970-1 [Araneus ventricosus]|uniref:Uncharacterized protein n=1 Tax=Araneus ventricosus TaxID=182803 RepID=A0A4Y2HKP0_ARAVE|nr:hypothetical protein AVEN_156970-1 [Araneus ventricosus]
MSDYASSGGVGPWPVMAIRTPTLVPNNCRDSAAAIRRGDTGLQKQTVQLRSTSEKFDFKTHFVLCAEEITDSYLKAPTIREIRQRNIVHKVELDSMRDSFFKAAETRGDDWEEKIITRIKDQDLIAKDDRYHLFCQRKL